MNRRPAGSPAPARWASVPARAAPVLGLAAFVLVLTGLLLAPAAPAAAHGGDAPGGTNYRTTVTAVTPALPGVTVRAVEAGARLELVNRSGRNVEVLGYQGEPYLEVRPDGVYENTRSPATYLNQSLTGGVRPPPQADPTAPPSWRRVAAGPVARWHDHRVHWMGSAPPQQVAADPGQPHRIRDWVVPLRSGVSTMEVRGTLDWLPPPAPGVWWAGCVAAVAALTTLGLRAPGSRTGRAVTLALGTLALAAGVAALAYAVAREVDAGATGAGAVLRGLVLSQLWPVLTALAALAAGGYALTRRPAVDFALALAGACLAISAGLPNATVFARSVAPVPWDPSWARVLVASVIILGFGLTSAGIFRIRAVARSATTT